MKTIVSIICCTLLVVGLGSCDLSQTNPNELSTGSFYKTQAQAEAAVNAVYASLQTIGLYIRRHYFIYDLLSNEAVGNPQLEPDLGQFDTYTVNPANPTLKEHWESLYRGIQRANLVLANVPSVSEPELNESLKNRYLAEARFLRAWYYYTLVKLWGPVPLVTEVPTQEEVASGYPRAPVEDVFAVIMEDLNFAEQHLPLAYGTDIGRVTQGAAITLKGKAHLWLGEYPAAETEFEKLVLGEHAGQYRLMDDYYDNFKEETENNAESIFEVQFNPTGSGNWSQQGSGVYEETYRGQEYGMTSWRNVIPSQKLLDEYEAGDPRYEMNFLEPCDTYNNGQNTVYTPNACPPPGGQGITVSDDKPSWRKYQNYYKLAVEPNANSGINFRVIRYAEVLLGLADAKIEQGKSQEAIDLMNQVRARVDMPPYPTPEYPVNSKAQLIDALYHEVASEFAGEQVLYEFLRRRPEYLQEWAGMDGAFDPDIDYHMPLPATEIDNNNALGPDDQNPY